MKVEWNHTWNSILMNIFFFSSWNQTWRHRINNFKRSQWQTTIHGWIFQKFWHSRKKNSSKERCTEKKEKRHVHVRLQKFVHRYVLKKQIFSSKFVLNKMTTNYFQILQYSTIPGLVNFKICTSVLKIFSGRYFRMLFNILLSKCCLFIRYIFKCFF